MVILISLAFGVLTGAVGAYIAERKNRSHVEGFILGFLLGLIGILIELILPKKEED